MCVLCKTRVHSSHGVTRRLLMSASASMGFLSALAGRQTVVAQTNGQQPVAGGLPPRGEFVIRDAHVISVDPTIGDLPNGDIHVRNGELVSVAKQISLTGVPEINARGMIAIPGLIETHWHMWGAVARNMAGEDPSTGYFRVANVIGVLFSPEDNARGVRLALAEALNGGLTTVHNWSHNLLTPDYAEAEIAAHRAFGGRARFAYGYSRRTKPNDILPLDDIARFQNDHFTGGDGLLTLGIASLGPESTTVDNCKHEWSMARRLGIPITCHMGTRSPAATKVSNAIDGIKVLNDNGLLGPDVLIVHATNCSKDDFDMMARSSAPVSLSPYTELRTGFGFTPVLAMLAAGMQVSLSVDTTLLCGNADMFAIMKAI